MVFVGFEKSLKGLLPSVARAPEFEMVWDQGLATEALDPNARVESQS